MSVAVFILFSATSLVANQSVAATVDAARPTSANTVSNTNPETPATVGDSSARGGSTASSSANATAAGPSAPLDAPFLRPVVRAATVVRPVQGTAAAGVLHPSLEIVDAGREDIGPLSTSLKSEPIDARLPTGFHRVYRVPGSDSQLMRGNGALFAVFPESIYQDGRALLPPGTVYHIGMPDRTPALLQPDVVEPSASVKMGDPLGVRIGTTVDARLDLRIRPARPAPIVHTERQSNAQSHGPFGARTRARTLTDDAYSLDGYLGAAARDANVDTQRSQHAAAVTEGSAPAMLPTIVPGSSALETGNGPKRSGATDPYAYLKLGPARLNRD